MSQLKKARDVFEDGMSAVITVRDFSVIFDSYSQFEESIIAYKMEEEMELSDEEDGFEEVEEQSIPFRGFKGRLEEEDFERKILHGFWLNDKNDIDLRLGRFDYLTQRRPELANNVFLRQNPHNVEQRQRRVELYEGDPISQILTYTEAVRTIDPTKAVGKSHTLWVAFAKLYEEQKDLANARIIFDKAVQVNYKTVDNLVSVWCEWVGMELKNRKVSSVHHFTLSSLSVGKIDPNF
ncbi:hypothetical protein ACSQ67_021138 [Phaseolus vulgaris]